MRPTVLDPRGWAADFGVLALVFRGSAAAAWAICMMLFGIYFPQRWEVDRRLPWAKWIFITPLALKESYDAARGVVASSNFTAAAQWPPLLPGALNTALIMTAVGIFFMALAHKYHDPALASDDKPPPQTPLLGLHRRYGPVFRAAAVFADRPPPRSQR